LKVFSKSDQFLLFLHTAEQASLILVDYNSNPDNGVEVLKMIKRNAIHKITPVVILSDSSFKKYKDECYALGASSFIQKPSKMHTTKEVIRRFFDYWITIAEV
jgi:DNA-binding NarL/FixJ family response regulator